MNVKTLLKSVPTLAMLLCAAAATAAVPSLDSSAAVWENAAKAAINKSAGQVRPMTIADDETIFTYAPNGLYYVYGTSQAGSYDMAIKLDGAAFAGAKVSGIRFYLLDDQYTTDVSAWTSTTLGDTPTGEIVDVDNIVVATSEDAWNEVRFTTPVEIPAEGLYCGYSLTITQVASMVQGSTHPIACGDESSAAEGGFFYRFTGSHAQTDWEDESSEMSLCMQVILTDVSGGASISLPEYIITKPGEKAIAKMTVYNRTGGSTLTVEYNYSLNGITGTGTATNDNANPLVGAANDFDIELPAIAETGEYPLTVELTKVNGNDNANDNAQATTTIAVTDLDIKHRAVVEEYTGAWCGNCPRGYVAMEYMAEKYPDDFIGLAYHVSDIMEASNVTEPQSVPGYPAAYLDRSGSYIDPYFGSGENEMGIEQDWLDRCAQLTPAAIEVTADMTEDGQYINATSRTAFVLSDTEGFTIAYALLADGLSGTGSQWEQVNYYSGYSSTLDIDTWDIFFNGGSSVAVEFNDVVIIAPDSRGVAGSVPEKSTLGEWNEHEYSFTVADATSLYYGTSLVQDVQKLRVVAMLINADGEITNAAQCKVTVPPSAVGNISDSIEEPVEVARYSIDGRLLTEPERGVNIVKMSDGTAHKEIVK